MTTSTSTTTFSPPWYTRSVSMVKEGDGVPSVNSESIPCPRTTRISKRHFSSSRFTFLIVSSLALLPTSFVTVTHAWKDHPKRTKHEITRPPTGSAMRRKVDTGFVWVISLGADERRAASKAVVFVKTSAAWSAVKALRTGDCDRPCRFVFRI